MDISRNSQDAEVVVYNSSVFPKDRLPRQHTASISGGHYYSGNNNSDFPRGSTFVVVRNYMCIGEKGYFYKTKLIFRLQGEWSVASQRMFAFEYLFGGENRTFDV